MTMPDPVQAGQEPDPEFNQRCLDILSHWQNGDLPFKDASDQLEAMGRQAQSARQPANQGRAELLLGVLQGYRANLDASISHFEIARGLFEQAGNRKRAVGALLNIGESYRLKGNFPRARQYFRAAYEAAEELDMIDTQAISACNEGLLLISMDQYEGAQVLLEKALDLADGITDDANNREELKCEIHHALASVYLVTRPQAPEEAWWQAVAALRIARTLDQPLLIGIASRAMGEVLTEIREPLQTAAAKGGIDVSEEPFSSDPDAYFQTASASFQEIKAEGEIARTLYVHGLSLGKRGKGSQAARKLQQAMIMFTRLGMTDDASKAARAQMEVLSNPG